MSVINQDIFIKEQNSIKVLTNITKYCSKCYKELSQNEDIYFNNQTYEYICSSCASCLSEELETTKEEYITEIECNEESLF